jgi:hypothetical protein
MFPVKAVDPNVIYKRNPYSHYCMECKFLQLFRNDGYNLPGIGQLRIKWL